MISWDSIRYFRLANSKGQLVFNSSFDQNIQTVRI